jgi:hypothetical protein
MAAGLVVITHFAGGMTEMITDGADEILAFTKKTRLLARENT